MVRLTIDRTKKGIELGVSDGKRQFVIELTARNASSLIANLHKAHDSAEGWQSQMEMSKAELENVA